MKSGDLKLECTCIAQSLMHAGTQISNSQPTLVEVIHVRSLQLSLLLRYYLYADMNHFLTGRTLR